MNNYDSYEIFDGEKNILIYPLMEFTKDNKNYIVYVKDINNLQIQDFFIGEIVNNKIVPVENDLNEFNSIINEAYDKVQKAIQN